MTPATDANGPADNAADTKPGTPAPAAPRDGKPAPAAEPEIGGPSGPEPTRYGDWEKRGRCIDF